MNSIPVYVVEDNEMSRLLLKEHLDRMGRSHQTFEHATAFLRAAPTLKPGIILLDLYLPGMNGLSMLDQLDKEFGPFAVLILSASTNVDDAIGAFHRGVADFLRKPYNAEDLREAIKETELHLAELLDSRQTREKAAKVQLTTREQQVLEAIAAGQQTKMIAFDLGISIRTVDAYRASLIAKLDARGASHALAVAKQLGLI